MNVILDPSLQGFINEDRFFNILEDKRTNQAWPDWMYSYRKATALEDSLGVDGFVRIYTVSGRLVRVPFQVKSSREGVIRMYQRYKVFWVDNLRCFVVSPDKPDRVIWNELLRDLTTIRQHNEEFRRVDEHLKRQG